MGAKHTPLLQNAQRVLVHVRGTLEPEECYFWERLRAALRERGAELMLTAHRWGQTPMDVPVLRARNGLTEFQEVLHEQGWGPWFPAEPAPDYDSLLERESLWNGPAQNVRETEQRRRAIDFFFRFYSAALKTARPALVLIWNGQHPQERILDRLSRQCGCTVQYIERGPFHQTLQLDPQGILADSSAARAMHLEWPAGTDAEHWKEVLREVEAGYRSGDATWWPQPERKDNGQLRKSLGIGSDDTVLLFAGQVDRDAQALFFSPHFDSNLAAFRWFCAHLPERENLFVLGKHHPMSPSAPEAFRSVLGRRGAWVTDIALADCLALADRVAAVNSTVLYEGLMLDKPILSLGGSLLSGKAIAYEVEGLEQGGEVLEAWLRAGDFDLRKERWNDFGAWLLATRLYTLRPPAQAGPLRGASALAEELAALVTAAGPLAFEPLTPEESFVDSVALWDDCRARSKEHEGFKEVLRGLNISLKASLGRIAPGVYSRCVHRGNVLYERFARRPKR